MQHNDTDLTSLVIYMIIYSFVIGYIFSMGLLADKLQHVTVNYNKIYMALLMAFSMGAYELWMMKESYTNSITLVLVSLSVLSLVMIYFIRNQVFIDDKQFLLSMIEHHSAALTMSKKIIPKSDDPFVINLAHNIIISQNEEIRQMQKRLDEM